MEAAVEGQMPGFAFLVRAVAGRIREVAACFVQNSLGIGMDTVVLPLGVVLSK